MPSSKEIFTLSAEQERFARNAAKRYKVSLRYVRDLIWQKRGCCAWSGTPLIFNSEMGTSRKGGPGPHPCYAALDHTSPRSDEAGHEVVCFKLNDVKSHLPAECFRELQACESWKRLMDAWRAQAEKDINDVAGFELLL